MRTRIASLQIEEDNDGRKRVVHRRYPADALLLLDPKTAGEGFLAIMQDLVNQLDGVGQEPAKMPDPLPEEPAPTPAAEPASAEPPKPPYRKPKLSAPAQK